MADNLIGNAGNAQALVQSLLNANQQQQASQNLDQKASAATEDAVQAAYVKKLQQKVQQQKAQVASQRDYSDQRDAEQRFAQATRGHLGQDLQAWANNGDLQKKLTDAQRQMFLKSAEQNPLQTSQAAAAMNRLATNDALLPQAASPLLNAVQAEVLSNPGIEQPLAKTLQTPFMRSANADLMTKQDFVRFAVSRMQVPDKGVSVRVGGDMMNSLTNVKAGTHVPSFAQASAMRMIQRQPDNIDAMSNVDNFVNEPAVRRMPAQARGEAVRVLTRPRVDGANDVRQTLGNLAKDSTFRSVLSRADKAQLFATIGQGRTTSLRAIGDKTLTALQSSDFPRAQKQIGKFLRTLGQQVAQGDGTEQAIDPGMLIKSAKRKDMPKAPDKLEAIKLDGKDANKARGENLARLNQYYTNVQTHYKNIDKALSNAKYFEDVNLLNNLKQVSSVDVDALAVSDDVKTATLEHLSALQQNMSKGALTQANYIRALRDMQAKALGSSHLSADEKLFVYAKTSEAELNQTYQTLVGQKRRKMYEVRSNKMPASKRRRAMQASRPQGVQRQYFIANQKGYAHNKIQMPASRSGPVAGSSSAATQQASKAMGLFGASQGPTSQTAAGSKNLVAKMGTLSTRQTARQIQTAIAGLDPSLSPQEKKQKAAELMTQHLSDYGQALGQMIAETLFGGASPDKVNDGNYTVPAAGDATGSANTAGGPKARASTASTTQGKSDGWGIPRSFERDLGAQANTRAVKPPAQLLASNDEGAPLVDLDARPLGPSMIKPTTPTRDMSSLQAVPWKQLTKPETALLRNLGWNQNMWDTKDQPQARLPNSMRTPWVQLSSREREAVRGLRVSAEAWDASVNRLA